MSVLAECITCGWMAVVSDSMKEAHIHALHAHHEVQVANDGKERE